MPTWTDLRIFVSGVTQYAMSSGKFEAQDINAIANEAYQTFVGLFGQPDPEAPQKAPPPVGKYIEPKYSAPASGVAAGGEPGPAEGKPFHLWANDKIRLGKDRQGPGGKTWGETTWAEAHQHALRGGKATLAYLGFLAGIKDNDPKFAASNAAIRARAASVIAAAAAAQPSPAADDQPF